MYFEKNVVKMQKKTYKMTSKTEFIGTFCCVDSLNDRKWLKCSYKRIKNTTIYRYHVAATATAIRYRRHEYVKEYSGRSVRRTNSGY